MYGAVACISETKNPIHAANALLEHGPHCMLVGQAADDMSKKRGLEIVHNKHFTTALRLKHWEQNKQKNYPNTDSDFGTVGAIALDSYGHLAVGGSTGGTSCKARGRVGDTAVLGAGLYADSKVAVVW